MVPYFGNFAEDATVRFVFNTFDSNDPSASVTITDLVDADLKVHKDGSVTQIVTDGATIVINFDGITGNHMVTIDTSVHADYTTGADYHVRMEGTTVDGATINAFIGHFSIENRFNAAADDLANGTDGLGALKTLLDAIPTTAMRGTDSAALASVCTEGRLAELDSANLPTTTDNILTDTAVIGALGAGLTDLGGMSTTMKAQVNTEVDTALDTSISELGVAAPTATPNLRTGLMMLYMMTRNQYITQTSGTDAIECYNDAGTIIFHKPIVDAAGDYTESKVVSG